MISRLYHNHWFVRLMTIIRFGPLWWANHNHNTDQHCKGDTIEPSELRTMPCLQKQCQVELASTHKWSSIYIELHLIPNGLRFCLDVILSKFSNPQNRGSKFAKLKRLLSFHTASWAIRLCKPSHLSQLSWACRHKNCAPKSMHYRYPVRTPSISTICTAS